MQYRSDRQIVESLLPVRLWATVIAEGIDQPDSEDARTLLTCLAHAQEEVVAGLSPRKAEAIVRRARRAVEIAKEPFVEAKAAVAKFGLCVFYFLDCLRKNGAFGLVDGSPLDSAVTAILAPEGTLTEFANIPKVDASAQKQARHMLTALQREGYFAQVVWA
ncbi:hypothetical protein [Shinella zoogloeoides]|uniref:hypothetical protein n=1 Tax=Shinella zoogloeoides TaxID=352475 RepID=UPI00299CF565|nr:hypothetical protein [Shinella zoogloeoides]WPE19889.1 hypothetical protein ShzoTeo12_10650 [Shinella zoogloeoides]